MPADLPVAAACHSGYFLFFRISLDLVPQIRGLSARPALLARGVRVVTDVERGMRWTRACLKTIGARTDGEVVWSWPPDAEVKLRGDVPRDDGGKKARSPGRARSKP